MPHSSQHDSSCQDLVVAPRFCGPRNYANGGYVAGRIVGGRGPAEVTLRRPVPLDRELTLDIDAAGRRTLSDEGKLLVEARDCTLDISPPAPPSWSDAEAATQRFVGNPRHSSDCFVCGIARESGPGLGVHCGPIATGEVASTWVPDDTLLGLSGRVRSEFVWAALDCPGAWSLATDAIVMLGRLSARIDRELAPGERCIVVGRAGAGERRKRYADSAVFSEEGELYAVARAVWFEIPEEQWARMRTEATGP